MISNIKQEKIRICKDFDQALDQCIMPLYLQQMKKEMLDTPRFLSIEQAKIVTGTYQKHENEPRILQRAHALKQTMLQIAIQIDPKERIVGNRTCEARAGIVSPEAAVSWIERELDTLPARAQDKFNVKEEDKQIFRDIIAPYWRGKILEDRVGEAIGEQEELIKWVVKINQKDHSQGHIVPNSAAWLTYGPRGLLNKAIEKRRQCLETQRDFYDAMILVYDGAISFIERYRDLAREMSMHGSQYTENLKQIANNCDTIASGTVRTFWEAIQSLWFLLTILHMESNATGFSPGRFDQYLYPYYRTSAHDGMPVQEAAELISGFWLKCNQLVYMRNKESANYYAGFPTGFNLALSGKDIGGNDTTNELSYLCLKAQEWMGTPQPNLSVRLHENTPQAFLEEAAKVVGKGSGMPQFFNDESIIPALYNKGAELPDAYDYSIIGCVELTTGGNSLGWANAAMFNMMKVLELVLNNGICLITHKKMGLSLGSLKTYKTFEDLENAFARQMQYFIDRMIECCEVTDRLHGENLPCPFLSGVISGCVEQGLDVASGGAKYNLSGIQAIQVANIADSLAALKLLVFDEQRISPQTLLSQLQQNYPNEAIRQTMLNKAPKYGNDVEWVDLLGAKWVKFFADTLAKYKNIRGGIYHAGLYTVSGHVPMGHNVGASADGRRAKEPLADGGLSAVYGRDINGPTALLKSVSRIDGSWGTNGTLLNMKFLPAIFQKREDLLKFVSLLRAAVRLKINHVQFNVVNKEELLRAKEHPELYKSLPIRVAGYTAYFVELSPDLQDEIIARTEYAI